jgi:hypothetical protein
MSNRLRGNRPRPSVRACDGQTSAEYIGILLLVAMVISAVVLAAPGIGLGERLEEVFCKIGGGDCTEQRAETEPCVIASSSREAALNLQVLLVDIGQGGAYLREDRSDGTTVFTITDRASLEAAVRIGARGRIGNVGITASAEASAGGRLAGAVQYMVPTEDAGDVEDALRKQGGFGQLLRDAAESGLAGPVIDDLNDRIFGEDEPELPEPSAEFIDASLIVSTSAGIGAEAGPVGGAELEAALDAAGGARRILSGPDEGDIELFIKLDGSASGSLSAAMLGPGLSAETSAVAILTLDGGTTPSKLQITASAGYDGSLDLGDTVEGVELGGLARILQDATVGASSGTGQSLELGVTLDLDDPANRDAALALLTRGSGAVPGLIRRIDEDGTITLQTADVESSDFEAGANVGLGVNAGADGSESTRDSATTSAMIRLPDGRGFLPRTCK